jgi:hypothetical protein
MIGMYVIACYPIELNEYIRWNSGHLRCLDQLHCPVDRKRGVRYIQPDSGLASRVRIARSCREFERSSESLLEFPSRCHDRSGGKLSRYVEVGKG